MYKFIDRYDPARTRVEKTCAHIASTPENLNITNLYKSMAMVRSYQISSILEFEFHLIPLPTVFSFFAI